jgi:hypothetical protein
MKYLISKFVAIICFCFISISAYAQPATPSQCPLNWAPNPCSSCIITDTTCGCTVWTYCGNSSTNDECRVYINCDAAYYAIDFIDDDTEWLWGNLTNTLADQTYSVILVRGGQNFDGDIRIELLNTPPT